MRIASDILLHAAVVLSVLAAHRRFSKKTARIAAALSYNHGSCEKNLPFPDQQFTGDSRPGANGPFDNGRLVLFGSVARGEARLDSDVDLLVEFVPGAKTYPHFFALAELLEERLGRRVELVTREALSPFFGPRILSEAEDVLRAA